MDRDVPLSASSLQGPVPLAEAAAQTECGSAEADGLGGTLARLTTHDSHIPSGNSPSIRTDDGPCAAGPAVSPFLGWAGRHVV
jgi:hypothetical protein